MPRTAYRLIASVRNGLWTVHAVCPDTGDRFGVEVTAHTEEEATARLSDWLAWQEEHTSALAALQQAERVYHRTIAGHAFAASGDLDAIAEARTGPLLDVDAARARLDQVRARRPR